MKTRKPKKSDIAYMLLGKAVAYLAVNAMFTGLLIWGFLQNTIY